MPSISIRHTGSLIHWKSGEPAYIKVSVYLKNKTKKQTLHQGKCLFFFLKKKKAKNKTKKEQDMFMKQ